ncbi:hypothetical protein HPB51_026187 [Rhipicephalus microplus]|uniref:Uncharacterized protein n=1 Tax=Rhipicephalus microplus TaxID=6941 RepID=A0A9J6DXX5_RHIMP|nr:hypothetical protein HPB51_026187 [Rhipicephalus microplus]
MARDGSTHREAAAKVRRRRSRHRKPPRTCSAKARDTPLPHITHSPPQASTRATNKHPQKDARNIDPDAWLALPSVIPPVERQHRPLKATSERTVADGTSCSYGQLRGVDALGWLGFGPDSGRVCTQSLSYDLPLAARSSQGKASSSPRQ